MKTRTEQLCNWLIAEDSHGKYAANARFELLKALGVSDPGIGVWAETYHPEALTYFDRTFPHD